MLGSDDRTVCLMMMSGEPHVCIILRRKIKPRYNFTFITINIWIFIIHYSYGFLKSISNDLYMYFRLICMFCKIVSSPQQAWTYGNGGFLGGKTK